MMLMLALFLGVVVKPSVALSPPSSVAQRRTRRTPGQSLSDGFAEAGAPRRRTRSENSRGSESTRKLELVSGVGASGAGGEADEVGRKRVVAV
ncbi:hypothetical protein B0H11DRAFT_2112736 [Mycena galericulata]|nr:hypothetical protein B0H11DRAFT_2112736 [Mycena galericulata]